MIKVLLLIKRRPGMTHQEFRSYYETIHVPLAISQLVHLRRYARNFARVTPSHPEPIYDAITELWFDNWEGVKQSAAYTSDHITGRILATDEAKFLDRSTMITLIVEESVSDVDAVRALPQTVTENDV